MLIGKDPPAPHRSHARGGPLQAGRHDNRGCAARSFAADVEDGDRILSVEIWADRASLDTHMTHDHTKTFLRVAPTLVSGQPSTSFYEIPDVG